MELKVPILFFFLSNKTKQKLKKVISIDTFAVAMLDPSILRTRPGADLFATVFNMYIKELNTNHFIIVGFHSNVLECLSKINNTSPLSLKISNCSITRSYFFIGKYIINYIHSLTIRNINDNNYLGIVLYIQQ